MIEILAVLFSFFSLSILFLFPSFFLVNKFSILKKLNFFDLLSVNIIFQFTIYLLFSFFYSNISTLITNFFFISLISLFIFFYYNKNIEINKRLLLSILLFTIIVLCNFFSIANNFKLQWDAVAHWFWKTQNFYQNGDLTQLRNLPYPFYPHLGTYLWASFWKLSILNHEYLGRLYYSYIYIVSIFAVLQPIKSKYFFILISSLCYLIFDSYALGGYQEYLVFFFITFIGRLFFLLKEKKINNIFFLLLFLLAINLLIWSKQEGVIYSAILFLTYIFTFRTELKNKVLIFLFLSLIVSLYFYLNFLFKGNTFFHEPIINSFYKFKNFKIFIDSFFLISLHLFKSLVQHPTTIISALLLLLLLSTKKLNFASINHILLFFALNIILIYAIFYHSQFPVESILGPVLGRLILQTSGFYLVSFVYFFNINYQYEK
jgi:hypothetical protein